MTRVSSALKRMARISRALGTDVSDARRKQTEKDGEQRLQRRFAVDRCERPRERDAEAHEAEAEWERCPEHRRSVDLR